MENLIFRYAAKYVSEYLDIMHEGLTVCMRRKEYFSEVRERTTDPGTFLEEVTPEIEMLTGERGQMTVWMAYALYDMVVDPNRE